MDGGKIRFNEYTVGFSILTYHYNHRIHVTFRLVPPLFHSFYKMGYLIEVNNTPRDTNIHDLGVANTILSRDYDATIILNKTR